MIQTNGVKRKLDGVVDSVPPNEGCEVLNGEVNDEELHKMKIRILLIVMTPTFW